MQLRNTQVARRGRTALRSKHVRQKPTSGVIEELTPHPLWVQILRGVSIVLPGLSNKPFGGCLKATTALRVRFAFAVLETGYRLQARCRPRNAARCSPCRLQ